MLTSDSRFLINDTECASKVIDGEAVIINLQNGTYYSLDGVGARAWELLAQGSTLGDTTRVIASEYDVAAESASADLVRLIGELTAERLLTAADVDMAAMVPATVVTAATRLPYVAPTLATYRDMSDLLALDPPLPRLEDVVWSEPEAGAVNRGSH